MCLSFKNLSYFWTDSSSKQNRRSMFSRDLTAQRRRSSSKTTLSSCSQTQSTPLIVFMQTLIDIKRMCQNIQLLWCTECVLTCSVVPWVISCIEADCLWLKTRIWNTKFCYTHIFSLTTQKLQSPVHSSSVQSVPLPNFGFLPGAFEQVTLNDVSAARLWADRWFARSILNAPFGRLLSSSMTPFWYVSQRMWYHRTLTLCWTSRCVFSSSFLFAEFSVESWES